MNKHARQTLLRIAAIIALCELIVAGMPVWLELANPWMAAMANSIALTALSAPMLYWWVARTINTDVLAENRRLNDVTTFQDQYDKVTGLMNRDTFMQKVTDACETVQPDDTPHILLFIDLDHFSVFSNSCGHEAADGLLRAVTHALTQHIRGTDVLTATSGDAHSGGEILARVGDDKFGLLLYHCPKDRSETISNRLIEAVHHVEFLWDQGTYKAGCSIGITMIGADTKTSNTAVRQANNACYTAKDMGRGRCHVYQDKDATAAARQEEIDWVAQIQDAIDNDLFVLYRQPITPLQQDSETGDRFEVLLRLDSGTSSPPTLPGHLMVAAERYSLGPAIDRWVITNTFATLDGLYGEGTDNQLKSCSINLSGATMAEAWLLELICEQFDRYTIRPDQICFEITETHAITSPEKANRLIGQLRQLGCHFSLDDFGSGLSSFPYLKQYKVDYLKIDGSLVKDITTDPRDRAMVEAINMMAHSMNLKTVAEWVEDEETRSILKEIGIDFGQGYLIAKPGPFPTVPVRISCQVTGLGNNAAT